MRAGYGPKVAVEQQGKTIHISLEARSIDNRAYLSAIRIACLHLGARSKLISEIAILNSFGAQGLVFETPAQCEAAGNGKLNDVAILGATHQF
jgi:hypothetical protein